MSIQQISSSEQSFLLDGIAQNLRNDGRSNLDYRHMTLETGFLTQTNGSSRIKLANTDILVSVKLETGPPDIQHPKRGKFNIHAECGSSALAAANLQGSHADETINDELALVMERILGVDSSNTTGGGKGKGVLDLDSLIILPGKLCWIVYVDAMILDIGGNLFDAISIATRAALYNTTYVSCSHQSLIRLFDKNKNNY